MDGWMDGWMNVDAVVAVAVDAVVVTVAIG